MEIKHNIQTGAVEFVTYIGGDGYSAPIVLKSDGTAQNYLYLQRDYQGSIVAVSDATGVVVEKRLFDAWGNVLVQDGVGNTLAGLTILDRGYTGHEHLQSVGLIHMNGRLYDAKLHRFLQPDNYVQDPTNTQNYNRYGYVLNNPLKYIDPSGELSWKSVGRWLKRAASDIVAGAAIIGGVAIVIASGGTLTPLAAGLIGAGVAHFGATYAEYSRTGDWVSASNNAGFNFSYTHNTDWGYDSKPNKNGINENEPVVKPKTVEEVKGDKGTNWATATLAFIGTDIAIPEPTDAAWPKWAGYAIAGGAAATYLYSGDYVTKMQREIDRISERATGPQGFQYALTANTSGYYPNVRGGTTYLNAGEVWKYGETTSSDRYSQTYLNSMGLKIEPQFVGNQMQIKIQEKIMIYGYFFGNGALPPGNKIFR
ncbi:RHS repeat domain-containing protein [Flavobacterium daejeonense]|uniref:RHS repeat domain-containing protein n=1 Tax=Flavobacterium daejeonense TaxID=350893 RepID=UPI0012DBF344|nr:RHS repeat-associated core domain-containing protein [Flavobacterium daejeonense]